MERRNQFEFLIEGMQPGWLSTRRHRWLYRFGLMTMVGISIALLLGLSGGIPTRLSGPPVIGQFFGPGLGLAAGLAACLFIGEASSWIWSLLVGLMFGLVFGLSFGFAYTPGIGWLVGLSIALATSIAFGSLKWLTRRVVPRWDEIETVETLDWSWRKAVPSLLVGVCAGCLFGISLALAIFEPAMLLFGISFGLAAGLVGAILGGLTTGTVETKMKPNQGILQSARVASRIGILVALTTGLPVGISTGWAWRHYFEYYYSTGFQGLIIGVTIGTSVGAAIGIAVALVFGGLACIQHFLLRFLLFRDGCVPWRYARFLDYTVDRIFLRKVGGGYIFVHRLLQEYFASLWAEEADE